MVCQYYNISGQVAQRQHYISGQVAQRQHYHTTGRGWLVLRNSVKLVRGTETIEKKIKYVREGQSLIQHIEAESALKNLVKSLKNLEKEHF